jgi:tetratricopeptide (TPR) repeat protein
LVLALVLSIAACSSGTKDKPVLPTAEEAQKLLRDSKFSELNARMSGIQGDYVAGRISDEELGAAFRVFYNADDALLPQYDRWVAAYPTSYVALLARGIYHRKLGQERRGGKFISETSSEQIEAMDSEFKLALRDLEGSARLEKKPLVTLAQEMDILANYSGSEETAKVAKRRILEESVKIDRGNTLVRRLYLAYLAPRWGGSEREMQAFLDRCAHEGLSEDKLHILKSEVLSDRGKTAKEAGNLAVAEQDFRQAIALGGMTGCFACLGETLFLEEKYADAIPFLTRAIAETPTDPGLLDERAYAYSARSMPSLAFNDYLVAANFNDVYAEAHVGVAYMNGPSNGVRRDEEAGIRWLRRCAAEGYDDCTRNLAIAESKQARKQ